VPRRRPAPVDVELRVALVRAGSAVLLARRPDAGRMAGLVELPTCEPSGARRLAEPDWPGTPGSIVLGPELGTVRHTITRHRIRAHVHAARWTGAPPAAPLAFVECAEVLGSGLTGLASKVLRARFAR
jgi:adenine-specific DNA glycosylase